MSKTRASILVAVTLAGSSLLHVQYAREARFYALLLLESAALLYAVVRWRETASWRRAAPVSLLAAASVYTNNVMLFYVLGAVAFALMWPGVGATRRLIGQSAAIIGVTTLLYLPWLPTFLEQGRAVEGGFWISTPGVSDFLNALATLAGTANYLASKSLLKLIGLPATAGAVATVTLVSLLLLLTLGLHFGDTQHRRRVLAFFAFALLAPVLLFAYSLVRQPIFMVKPLIASSPALILAIAASVEAAWTNRTGRVAALFCSAVLLAMGIASTVGFLTEERKEDWRGAAAYVQSLAPAKRLIVFVANEGQLPFDYYDRNTNDTRTGAPAGFFDLDPPRTMRRVLSDDDLNPLRRLLQEGKFDEVVVVLSHEWFADPERRVTTKLASRWRRLSTQAFNLVRVDRYDVRSK